MALSTQPYKGARDFYPEDKRLQKYMFGVLRTVAEKYGYEEYDAPILEPLEIYLAKSGEEIVNEQTYVFEDRGGRKVVIRPEMTPTVSRMVAGKRQELAYPLRWYSIPNLWRYERPQRGRLREHWQLNVDIFGVADVKAEVEVISLVNDVFKTFGATEDMYNIRLNDRKFVNYVLHDYLNLNDDASYAISKLIDRMHKMERSDFISKVDDVLTTEQKTSGATEKLLNILDATDLDSLPTEVKSGFDFTDLQNTIKGLASSGITNYLFDPTLMRGFDYYTGIVFEVFDTDPENNRAMLGGGRYDGLVGLFGVEPVPTVGFGWGDVTLANFLEVHNLVPALVPETDIYVVLVGDVSNDFQPVLSKLRNAGLRIAVDCSGRKLGDQLKSATKRGIAYALVVGETEIKTGVFTLKNLNERQEDKLTSRQIIDLFKKVV
jgi:histidyl-tRNA synthetase